MPPVGKGKRVQLHKELDAFLDASNTDQASIDALSKYLQSRADEYGTIVEKLLPADEIEERLRIAHKIQAEIWDGIDDEKLKDLTRLTVLQLAIIMTIPLEYLRQNVSDSLPFDAIRRLVHLFLSAPRYFASDDYYSPPSGDSGTETIPEREMIKQNRGEGWECRKRDGYGCVLGTDGDEVCHIVPFGLNSSKSSFYMTSHAKAAHILLPGPDSKRRFQSLLLAHLGCSDKAWNMLDIDEYMQHAWARASFALKCVGVVPETEEDSAVQLQFYWMPNSQALPHGAQHLDAGQGEGETKTGDSAWKRTVNLDMGEGKKLVEDWKQGIYLRELEVFETGDIGYAEGHPPVSCLPHSGGIFPIIVTPADAEKMKTMLDIQWACIQIATMSGAAGSAEFLADDTFNEDAKPAELRNQHQVHPAKRRCPSNRGSSGANPTRSLPYQLAEDLPRALPTGNEMEWVLPEK